jgi:hypothetical protein
MVQFRMGEKDYEEDDHRRIAAVGRWVGRRDRLRRTRVIRRSNSPSRVPPRQPREAQLPRIFDGDDQLRGPGDPTRPRRDRSARAPNDDTVIQRRNRMIDGVKLKLTKVNKDRAEGQRRAEQIQSELSNCLAKVK